MKTLIIHPHLGLDRIRFGMARAEVAQAVGIPARRFKRNQFTLEEDAFQELCLTVSYDEAGHCNAIGVAHEAHELDYEGYALFAHPARVVREWARARDPGLDPREGFTSKSLGLAMWADWIDEPTALADLADSPATSFLIFRPGYHEEESARSARGQS